LSKVLLPIVLVAQLASCARPVADNRAAAAPDPSDLFRDVCGRIDDGPSYLARVVESRGFRRAHEAAIPRLLVGQSLRVWTDARLGDHVFIALDRRSGACTVAARRADLGAALRRFSEDVLGQASPYRTVVRADDDDAFAGDDRPMRAGFRVVPRRAGAPVAFLYTFSGDPSATADVQLVLHARPVSPSH